MDSPPSSRTATPRLFRALAGKPCTPSPVWLMRQAGRYLAEYRELREKAGSFLDLCYTPELAARVTLQPIDRFGFDAAILFSDILVVPDALGQKVTFVEGEGPRLEPLESEADIARLNQDGMLERLSPVMETVERVRASLDDETALIGFCGAPWTVATYMIGGRGSADQAATRTFAYTNPRAFQALIDLLVEVSAGYLAAQARAGAQVLQIFDSWAGNLPEDEFARWCVEPARRMVAQLRDEVPGVPVIGFPRGAGPLTADYVRATGIHGVGCDTSLPLRYIREKLQPLACVQGNLDPLLLAAGGPALDARIDAILSELSAGPFIFNLGHGIVPYTPPEHVAQLVERVRR